MHLKLHFLRFHMRFLEYFTRFSDNLLHYILCLDMCVPNVLTYIHTSYLRQKNCISLLRIMALIQP